MSNFSDIVTVVNRTSKPLKATWDGRPYDLPPGETMLPRIVAIAARFQNPIMGKGTPLEDWNVRSEYLVGIKEENDPIDPVEQTEAPQRWDTVLVNGVNIEFIKARAGYGPGQERLPAKPDEGFVKP